MMILRKKGTVYSRPKNLRLRSWTTIFSFDQIKIKKGRLGLPPASLSLFYCLCRYMFYRDHQAPSYGVSCFWQRRSPSTVTPALETIIPLTFESPSISTPPPA